VRFVGSSGLWSFARCRMARQGVPAAGVNAGGRGVP
jgi:hypothetical protein